MHALSCFVYTGTNNCTDREVRLVGGSLQNEGRVEICFDNLWGSICDDSWDNADASVVCRQLGYADTLDTVPLHGAHFGHALATFHLDNLDCRGNETDLGECPHNGVGIHNCFNDEEAGVVCASKLVHCSRP